MLGGNVAYCRNAVDVDFIVGRVSSAGVIVAPTQTPHFTVAHTGSSGVYTIVFNESFPVFLGAQVCLEEGIPTTAAYPGYTWTASTRTLTVSISTDGTTPAGQDVAFSFVAFFAEVNVPT